MIFVLIAGSYTPITLLALQPAWGISLLAIVWTVAVIGVTLALTRFGALHRAGGYLYIGMGWIVVIALPAVVTLAEHVGAPAALRRRRALHGRRDRAAAAAAEPPPARVRVPRGVARHDGRRRGVPLHARRHARPRLSRHRSRALARSPARSMQNSPRERRGSPLRRARRPTSRWRSAPTTARRFGPSDARTTIVVRSPDALRRIVTAPDELGFGRAYVAGELEVDGDIFDVMAVANYIEELQLGPQADRRGRQARRVDGPQAAPAAARRGPAPRPPPLARARRRRDRAPLRRVERLLPDGARAVAHLLVRGVARRHHDARGRAGEQVRADLPQARPRAGDAPPRRRVRLGRHAAARGRAPRRRRRSASRCRGRRPSSPRKRVGRARPRRSRRGALRRLPRRRRRPVRRDQLDRHVRARRARRSSTSTSRAAARLLRPEGRLLNHGISRPAPRRQDAPPPLGAVAGWVAASPSATCSPTASCTRSATWSRRSSAPGSRPATSRACASTTRSRCAAGSRNLEANWDDAVAEVGPGRARVWRLYMAAAAVGLRARRQPGAPGAGDRDHRRRQRDAPPARIHLTTRAR